MAERPDDDLAGLLPDQPPPGPARREAAIAEALRRFDGAPAVAPARRAPPRTLRRPWIGGLVAATLVLVIGGPVAWREWNHGNPSVSDPAARRAIEAPAGPAAPEVASEAAAPAPAQPTLPAPGAATAPVAAPAMPVPAEDVSPAAPAMVAPPPPPPPPPPPAPAPALAEAAPQREAEVVDRRERTEATRGYALRRDSPASGALAAAKAAAPAPPPPPAPPPAPASAASRVAREDANRAMDDGGVADVVVTATRRRSSAEPPWRSCTPDDPRRNLAACGREIQTGAKGPRGAAAAALADGLRAAWNGDDAQARTAFDRAIAADPRWALAWLSRGLARREAGDLRGALADLDQAVRLAPGAARGWYARGLVRSELGDERRARSDRERAAELDPAYDIDG